MLDRGTASFSRRLLPKCQRLASQLLFESVKPFWLNLLADSWLQVGRWVCEFKFPIVHCLLLSWSELWHLARIFSVRLFLVRWQQIRICFIILFAGAAYQWIVLHERGVSSHEMFFTVNLLILDKKVVNPVTQVSGSNLACNIERLETWVLSISSPFG